MDAWFLRIAEEDCGTADLIEQAIDMLAVRGPTLGRPLVDHIKSSSFHNMKELRPASAGCSEVRILFAFDPGRRAILLVAGDKAGNWREWYSWAVPTADRRYGEHLADLDAVRGRN